MPDVIHRHVQEEELGHILLDELEVGVAAQVRNVVDGAGTKLSMPMTLWPRVMRRSARCEPRKPAAPVTSEVGIAADDTDGRSEAPAAPPDLRIPYESRCYRRHVKKACLAALAAASLVPAAHASGPLKTALYVPTTDPLALQRIHEAGATFARINVSWAQVAPVVRPAALHAGQPGRAGLQLGADRRAGQGGRGARPDAVPDRTGRALLGREGRAAPDAPRPVPDRLLEAGPGRVGLLRPRARPPLRRHLRRPS